MQHFLPSPLAGSPGAPGLPGPPGQASAFVSEFSSSIWKSWLAYCFRRINIVCVIHLPGQLGFRGEAGLPGFKGESQGANKWNGISLFHSSSFFLHGVTFMFFSVHVQETEEFQEVQDSKVCWNSVGLSEDFVSFEHMSECGLISGEPGDGGLRGPKGQCRFLKWTTVFWSWSFGFGSYCMFRGVFQSSSGAIFLGDSGSVGAPGPAGEKGARGSTGESFGFQTLKIADLTGSDFRLGHL